MARYRARSGSALSAISLGIMIAVIVCAVAVARYSNVFDYVGPNMASNTINVYTPPTGPTFGPERRTRRTAGAGAEPLVAGGHRPRHRLRGRRDGRRRRSSMPPANLQNPSGNGRQWNGPDLRGDAGAAAGLRHQPVVDPVERGHPQLAARAGRLGRAAHLRRRRRQGRRPAPAGQPGGPAGRPNNAQYVLARLVPRPPGGARRRASCPSARRRRTR